MKAPLVVGLLVCAGAAEAAQRPRDFAYGVQVEADGNEALYEVVLPATVYRGVVRADLADVRVFNSAGEVVPHAWRPRRTTETESARPVALTLFPLKAEQGTDVDGISIRVHRGAGGQSRVDVTSTGRAQPGSVRRTVGYLVDLTTLDRTLRAIELDWQPMPDGFAGNIRVDASEDLGSWRTLVAAAPLVSLQVAGQHLQQKRIELPQQTAKYLRLSWVQQGGKALPELTSATGEPVGKIVEAAREWTRAEAAMGDAPGAYVFDLRGHYPVDRLRVHLPEPNTVVQAEWLVRDRLDQAWRSVARGVVYRLRRDGSEIVGPEVPVDLATERYWLLRVDQRGGGVGSSAPGLEAGWVPHTVVFAARGAPPFQIAYGNRDAESAAYAIETLVPDHGREPRIPAAKAGTQQELGGEARLEDAIDWKRLSLWGSLVLGVLILGGMAWRLVRQMNSGDGV